MFERYTERARRVIFFARYEASAFGSTTIETEHLLLGLIREDKNLTNRFLRAQASIEDIRRQIEAQSAKREKVSTSIDLPLSNECKRILAYAYEEAEHLKHRHIGTEHLLLGILREENCVAAGILTDRGLRLDAIREELAMSAARADQEYTLSSSMGDLAVDLAALLGGLDAHGFGEPRARLIAALEAGYQQDWKTAQVELQIFLEAFVDGIRERGKGANVDFPIFQGFDWHFSLRGLTSGLSGAEDWKFRCNLTLLLAQLLLKRLQQRLNS